MIVLIHPPVAKPSEPPAGIARLSGFLKRHGIEHRLLDANIEGLLHLLGTPCSSGCDDPWSRRSLKNRERNVLSLRDSVFCQNFDRYKRAVNDISRAFDRISPKGVSVGLANYEHKGLSPLKTSDLLAAAERPETNPFYPYFRTRLAELFAREKPSFAGISLNYLSQALPAFSMIGHIRKEFPGVKIILGGGLTTSWSANSDWKKRFSGLVDHAIAGPGEYGLPSLLGLKAEDRNFPKPEYGGLPRELYLAPGLILPYSASAGCYWKKCSFCPEKAEANPYIPVSVSQAQAEIESLVDETGPSLIHLLDNAVNPALLESLAKEPPGVAWYGFARINERLADPDFCSMLKRSGCAMLKLGIESGDQNVLDALEKGISTRIASEVLRNLRDAGIASYVYLLFGTPPEDETSARRTLEFTVQHADSITFLNLAIFNMPVSAAAASGLEIRDFSEGDLSLYTDFRHPAGWDRKRVRFFLNREFSRHPAVSAILKNDPPVFTSNHAAYFAKNTLACLKSRS